MLDLTASFDIHLLRPVSEGTLRATGRVVHRSRRRRLAAATLLDSAEREIGRGSGAFISSEFRRQEAP